MKNLVWFSLLLSISTSFSVNAQTPSQDFCKKFPLNSRCKDNSSNNSSNSRPSNLSSRDHKIVDVLTLKKVEEYLRELGYINFTRKDRYGFSFLIEGRPCILTIGSNGQGITLSSIYPLYPQDKKITLEVINDWNNSFQYSFASIWTTPNNNKSVFLSTTLTVTGGVAEKRVKNFFIFHSEYQRRFSKYLTEL